MGTFYTKCTIENHVKETTSVFIPKILVDTGVSTPGFLVKCFIK